MAEQAFGVNKLKVGTSSDIDHSAGKLRLGGANLATEAYVDAAIVTPTAGDGIAVSGAEVSVSLAQGEVEVVLSGATNSAYDGTYTFVAGGSGEFGGYDDNTNPTYGIYSKSDGASGYHVILRVATNWKVQGESVDPSTWSDGQSLDETAAETLGAGSNSVTLNGYTAPSDANTAVSSAAIGAGSYMAIDSGDLKVDVSTDVDFANDQAKIATRAAIESFVDTEIAAVTASSLGLGNVDNTSDANKPVSTAQQTALDAKVDTADLGVANGVATLDGSGLIPSSQLPSYVDDVLEYANEAAFPGTGETGKIYVALDNNSTHRWTGSVYVEISNTGVADDEITSAKIADDAVDSEHLVDNSVDLVHLASEVTDRMPVHTANASAGSTEFTLDSFDATVHSMAEFFVQCNDGTDSESYKIVADEAGNYSVYAHLGIGNITGFSVSVDKSVNDVRVRCASTADHSWKCIKQVL